MRSNSVRSLFWRRVKRISCKPSSTLVSPGWRVQRNGLPGAHDQAVLQCGSGVGLISDVLS